MPQIKPKIEGKFYPLQADELIYLCQILTDAELKTLLYLKSIHPFTDSYKELDTSAIAEYLNISRRSIQRFLKKFKELSLIDWEVTKFKYKPLQLVTTAGSPKRQQDRQNDTGIVEATAGSPKRQQDRHRSLEPLPNKDYGSLQTIQTIHTSQTGGGENFSNNSDVLNNEENKKSSGLTNLSSILSQIPTAKKVKKEEKTSSASSICEVKPSTPSKEIEVQLKALKIPLDDAVRKAIATHHPSQIKGALAHIEETSDEIRSPRAIFLYQVPRQEVDKRKEPKEHYTAEFREWYKQAIAQGIVIDRPIETLGLYQFREPIVQLPDGGQHPWTRVRDGIAKVDTEEERRETLLKMAAFKKKLQQNAANHGNSKYLSTQEKAKQQLEKSEVSLTPSKDPSPPEPLPPELAAELKKMGIPLNDIVKKAIASHPLEQIEAILIIIKEKLKAIGEKGGYNAQKLFNYHLMAL